MREEKVLNDAVVCFLISGNEILLAMKTDKIGKGCWNGYGGGIEFGELTKEAGVRELWEESGVVAFPQFMKKVAEVDFHNTKSDGVIFICKVHYFFVYKWLGVPESRSKEKMVDPTWFSISEMPYDKMMPADEDFMPLIFREAEGVWLVKAKAFLGPFQKEVLKSTELVLTKKS